MTVEEKLQHFYDVAMGEAKKEAEAMLNEHQEKLNTQLEQHKQDKLRQAEQDIKTEIDNAKREVNKALSAQQLVIKRDWSRKQTELKDKLFNEVKDMLETFMASADYEPYLAEKIMEAHKIADGQEIHIFVTAADQTRIPSLVSRTGIPVEVSEEAFIGGIKAIIPDKNILIDYSFLDSFITLRKEFTFDGGIQHE